MIKVKLDGVVFEGEPAAIVRAIKEGGIDFSGTNTLDEYMDWLAKNIFKMHGVGVSLPDGPTDERAAALVSQLIHAGLFEKVAH